MRDEELRSRLQALAVAGRTAAGPAPIVAVRRRSRRKVQGGVVLLLVGLLLAGAGVRFLSEEGLRREGGPVPPVAPPAGPPAAVAPTTFVAQVGDGATRRTVVVDARTGRIVRQVPGSERQSVLAADAVVGPDLRTMYLPASGGSPASACDPSWTQLDLATGARRPAFGGLTGVGEFSLSADGAQLAFVHTTPAGTGAQAGASCRTELVVRQLASGRQRVWAVPPGASVSQLQWSPDATQLAYLLRMSAAARPALHLLPLAGTTSVTQGHDLPPAGDCPLSDSSPRFLDGGRRLLALGARNCATGPVESLLVEFDPATRRVLSRVRLGLPGEIFSLDVDRSGRHVIIAAAGKANDQRPATAYVLRDGHPQRVPLPGDCWQADW